MGWGVCCWAASVADSCWTDRCCDRSLTGPLPAPAASGVIVPPLPEKNVVEKYKMTTEFIEQRRAALTIFINRVVRS